MVGLRKSFIPYDAVAPPLGNATPDHEVLNCGSDQEAATSVKWSVRFVWKLFLAGIRSVYLVSNSKK
jgi:hypothetical protein